MESKTIEKMEEEEEEEEEVQTFKTGALALPIIQSLLDAPQAFFALVLSPTRELAIQIAERFEALGSSIGVKSAVLVGGVDQLQQSIQLGKRPHIVVATPGCLVENLSNTKGISLRTVKYLVFDEADRLLNVDFEKFLNERRTYLFSATTITKKIEADSKYSTVVTLKQLPDKHKDEEVIEFFLGFMDDHYPVRRAFSLSNQVLDLLDEYQKNFDDSLKGVQADSSQPCPSLKEALTRFQHKTIIDSVLVTGENLDTLVEKSIKLSMAFQVVGSLRAQQLSPGMPLEFCLQGLLALLFEATTSVDFVAS
ncbi:uncharacterized protein [Rutidosis leptorrhynchoides]|uniref:uncharacterized protein n=1 Tax=Rutidosis leptorrhynchoides TaxID=125765 RepID=UPI003A9A1201